MVSWYGTLYISFYSYNFIQLKGGFLSFCINVDMADLSNQKIYLNFLSFVDVYVEARNENNSSPLFGYIAEDDRSFPF